MTGHTGYITHARKILKLPQPAIEPVAGMTEEKQETTDEETVDLT